MNKKSDVTGWEYKYECNKYPPMFKNQIPFRVKNCLDNSLLNSYVITYALESLNFIETGEYEQLSPAFVHSVTEDPTSLLNLILSAKTFGAIKFECFPLVGNEIEVKDVVCSVKNKLWKNSVKVMRYFKLETIENIKSFVCNGDPATVLLHVNSEAFNKISFWKPEYKSVERPDTFHPLLISGYDEDFIYCLSAKGLNFGEQGIIKIKTELFSKLLVEAWGLSEINSHPTKETSINYKKFNIKGV